MPIPRSAAKVAAEACAGVARFLHEGGVEAQPCTLGGAVRRCGIEGKVMKDPGDLDGDGLLVVSVTIVLP